MAVLSRARKQGFSLTLHDVLQSGSIAELAEAAGSSVTLSHHEEKTGEYFRLSPIQDLYFRAPNASHGDAHFNQSITVRVTRRVDPDVVNQAIKAVVSQHSMFRARFSVSEAGEWQQSITDVRETPAGICVLMKLTQ